LIELKIYVQVRTEKSYGKFLSILMESGKKVAVVTGGNAGIGKQTAKRLAENGFHTILACRSVQKGIEAMNEINKGSISGLLEVVELELSDLASVQKFAEEIKKKYEQIDVLVNNAGVFMDKYEETPQGIEKTFAVNYLSHFYLTLLLLDAMSKNGRIINVASQGQGYYYCETIIIINLI
jgi:retinol dehydrogenase-14